MAIVDNAFREWIADFKAINPGFAESRQIIDTAQYAFAAGRKAQRKTDAARQPVGEPVSEKLMRLLRERAALPESVELSYLRDGDGTGHAWWDRRHAELEAQGYCLDFETDSGAEWHALRGIGDELRATLAEYDTAPPAQAVDLGQLERFDMEGVPTSRGWDVIHNRDETGEWVRYDDVKALIDSQAVGK